MSDLTQMIMVENFMPASNLIFLNRDGVFDCCNRITGKIKKKYTYNLYDFPRITETLQSNTTLVVVSHGNPEGVKRAINKRCNVTDFVGTYLFSKIQYSDRISKVVYLVCSSSINFVSSDKFEQVAANGTLILDGSTHKLKIDLGEGRTINQILQFTIMNTAGYIKLKS
jgi:hypothetical protein